MEGGVLAPHSQRRWDPGPHSVRVVPKWPFALRPYLVCARWAAWGSAADKLRRCEPSAQHRAALGATCRFHGLPSHTLPGREGVEGFSRTHVSSSHASTRRTGAASHQIVVHVRFQHVVVQNSNVDWDGVVIWQRHGRVRHKQPGVGPLTSGTVAAACARTPFGAPNPQGPCHSPSSAEAARLLPCARSTG